MFRLRAYQKEALSAVMKAIKTDRNVLVQAATGAGKTILFSALIKRFLKSKKDARVYVLAHREQLIWQARSKLCQVWPECEKDIGLACASTGRKVDVYKPIVIGSPQTLSHGPETLPRADMVIIDECHRLAPANKDSQYRRLIDAMRGNSPEMRLVGVTATPYRLGQGLIYGEQCKDKGANWFDSMCFSIGTELLQEQGYLVPLRLFAPVDPDLSEVGTADGDYIVKQLSDTMSKAVHVHSALDAVERHASDRKHIVVFAVSIQHAEILRDSFRETGRKAEAVHSKMPHGERLRILDAFDSGEIEVLCNVGVLTEGWDCKSVDCMVMCRPTKSPALYVQMAGRGLRTCKGKKDCIMLDVSGNWTRHGRPENPDVKSKNKTEPIPPQGRRCPECGYVNKHNAQICEQCRYEWPTPEGMLCPVCGADNGSLNISCFKCGHIFNESPLVELREVQKSIPELEQEELLDTEKKLIDEIEGELFLEKEDGYPVDVSTGLRAKHHITINHNIVYEYPYDFDCKRDIHKKYRETKNELLFLSIFKLSSKKSEDFCNDWFHFNTLNGASTSAYEEIIELSKKYSPPGKRVCKSDIREFKYLVDMANDIKILKNSIDIIAHGAICNEIKENIPKSSDWKFVYHGYIDAVAFTQLTSNKVAVLRRRVVNPSRYENIDYLSIFKFVYASMYRMSWIIDIKYPYSRWRCSYM